MNINELERRYGRYAIKNLSVIVIGIYVLGYIISAVASNAMYLLMLDPYRVIHHGEIWRVVSWLLIPPSDFSLFTLINLYFIFSLGRMLERIWGNFRYNLYVLGGVFLMIIGVFLIYGVYSVTGLASSFELGGYGGKELFSMVLSYYVSTYYIMLTVILAFSMTVPDMTVMLYFIIPIKMRWLAYLDMFLLGISFFQSPVPGKLVMLISVLNFFIFMITSRKGHGGNSTSQSPFSHMAKPRQPVQRKGFSVYEGNGGGGRDNLRHKCVVCGITEKDAPKMIFRYCSKCRGAYEYCEDHLYTHTHVE